MPAKVDEAFRLYRYVPYTALTREARARALAGEGSFVVNAQGGLTAKGLDRSLERSITAVQWTAASQVAVERTRHYHGEDRAAALASHHQAVTNIAHWHTWQVAVDYDIYQRNLAADNHSHNLTGVDHTALTLVVGKAVLSSHSPLPPSNLHQPVMASGAGSTRRAPADHQGPARKKPRSSNCFRCGGTGHMPGDCSAESTSAGKPVAPLATNARSRHALASPTGKPFCFAWARESSCSFGSECTHFHGCSICRDTRHGAADCRSQA